MGIYSHHTTEELKAMRQRLSTSLMDRLTKPTSIGHGGGNGTSRNATYSQDTDKIKREIEAIGAEIERRSGAPASRGPIYLV